MHIIVLFACSVAQWSQFSGRKCSFQAQLILASHNTPPGWTGQKREQRAIAGRQSGRAKGWKFTDWSGVNGGQRDSRVVTVCDVNIYAQTGQGVNKEEGDCCV